MDVQWFILKNWFIGKINRNFPHFRCLYSINSQKMKIFVLKINQYVIHDGTNTNYIL